MCDQVKLTSTCSNTDSSKSLGISDIAIIFNTISATEEGDQTVRVCLGLILFRQLFPAVQKVIGGKVVKIIR